MIHTTSETVPTFFFCEHLIWWTASSKCIALFSSYRHCGGPVWASYPKIFVCVVQSFVEYGRYRLFFCSAHINFVSKPFFNTLKANALTDRHTHTHQMRQISKQIKDKFSFHFVAACNKIGLTNERNPKKKKKKNCKKRFYGSVHLCILNCTRIIITKFMC